MVNPAKKDPTYGPAAQRLAEGLPDLGNLEGDPETLARRGPGRRAVSRKPPCFEGWGAV